VRQVRTAVRERAASPIIRPGGTWRLDKVFVKINGKQWYPWWAVDQDGDVLGILVHLA
jgi:transposase-like protein